MQVKSRPSAVTAVFAVALAVLLFAGAIAALADHPAGWSIPAACALFYVVVLFRFDDAWLFLVPLLLPIVDQTASTGRIFVTEADILMLLTLGVCYLKTARRARVAGPPPQRGTISFSIVTASAMLLASYSISTLLSLWPWIPESEQLAGYHSQWNGLRVAKGFFIPLLFAPLLRNALIAAPEATIKKFCYGMCSGLAAVSLYALYERLAFAGLSDFSSDYRITASFWEMNVGGAALDGFLALTLPFAVWLAATARTARGIALGMILLTTATYVLLVTFSRGVYAGMLAIVVVILVVRRRERFILHATNAKLGALSVKALWACAAVLLAFAMHRVFQTGGYRTLAALIAVIIATHYVGAKIRLGNRNEIFIALVLTVFFTVFSFFADQWIPKGAYLAFAAISAALVLAAWKHLSREVSGSLVAGLWAGLAVAGGVIAMHWGGGPARDNYVPIASVIVMIGVAQWLRRKPAWNWSVRSSSALMLVTLLCALWVAIVGNYQMTSRFSQTSQNLGEREQHWKTGISFLHGWRDWLFGRGTGTFPKVYFSNARDAKVPGTIAFRHLDGDHFVRLTGNHYLTASGEMYRLMQRVVADEIDKPIVEFRARANQNAKLVFEVCGRQLIYPDGCVGRQFVVARGNGNWQNFHVALDRGALGRGPWYAPRRIYFAFGTETSGVTVDISDIQLIGARGTNLLKNGDFRDADDHWFFSSDRYHLPWHIKNLFLDILFDQGLFGLAAFSIYLYAALLRAYRHRTTWTEAPYFLAAIVAFICVGLFDSLLDVPRVAMLFYFACWIMLLRPSQPVRGTNHGKPPEKSLARSSGGLVP